MQMDEYLQGQLLLSAMLITTHVLCPKGTFVSKIFRGRNIGFLYAQLRLLFERVSVAKPSSSRNSSMESFVVCQNFKGGAYTDLPLEIGGFTDIRDYISNEGEDASKDSGEERAALEPTVVPFLACGDLSGWAPNGTILDSDKSYPMDPKDYIAPISPPIAPPYESSIARQKAERQKRA
jgi:tRNA (cytidine32/guanosine34-2'-O)-methyltransferase